MNDLINEIRNIIANNSTLVLNKVFSPEMPKDGEKQAAISVFGGVTSDNLSAELMYSDVSAAVLIRGTESDEETVILVDSIFDALHNLINHSYTGGFILKITCQPPAFAFKDENQRNLYNINFNIKYR